MKAWSKVLISLSALPVALVVATCGRDLPTVGSVSVAEDRPSYDFEEFKASAQTIARADLLACRNGDAAITRPSNASIGEFAKELHGTWIGRRRSMHGTPVEVDQIFLIDLRGARGAGILIDRSNLGSRFAASYEGKAPVNTYNLVDCTYELVDSYEKVSENVDLTVLGNATGVPMNGVRNLSQAWDRLVRAGYFNSFDLDARAGARPDGRDVRLPRHRNVVLGDGQTVTAQQIAQGLAPGAEFMFPSITGGVFDITLTLHKPAGSNYNGIHMNWDASYRAVGLDVPAGQAMKGVERGLFMKEGNAYVSAMQPRGEGRRDALAADNLSGSWATSDCGDKLALEGSITPAVDVIRTQKSSHADHEHEHSGLTFDRVVIGSP
jgi:hypothetical protein